MNKLEILQEKAKVIVDGVSNDPQGRYQLRYEFYQKYGDPFAKGKEGLGNSELAFIKWEIKRGTLNALEGPHSGSPWWREVNSHFLYVATLAQLIKESGEAFQDLPVPASFWLDYIDTPNECSWYRAHNSSIISGYQVANRLAHNESIYEQCFMNIVLYRLLFAQSMVEGVSFGILGKIFANPRGFAVALITGVRAFYPDNYPMSKEDIKYVTHRARNFMGFIEDVFDKLLISPHLNRLYNEAANWNRSPILVDYVRNNKPIYPITEK
ncbi:hypothetical protein [Aquimarina mytili]|uniref:Uncharacterized protein n=1 Tax=Aquimarina mytili TaxID=874423 RepID=A0A937A0R0_9FLAO|nr:hypothetical protein [Aquimarina mytili]MBL0682895.1 hypothetical protein [Aquimarina mytili]